MKNTTISLKGSWSKVTCTYKTKPLRQEYIFSDKPYQVCVFAFSQSWDETIEQLPGKHEHAELSTGWHPE